MFDKFQWFIKSYKKGYIMALISLFLSDIFGLIPPLFIGYLTDKIFSNDITMEEFTKVVGLFIIVVLVKYFFAFGWSYFVHRASNEIEYQSRSKLMKKFLLQSAPFFEKNSTGSLMAKSTNDVVSIGDFAGIGTLSMFDSTIFPLCIILVMGFTVHWKLTLLSVLPLPLLAYLVVKIGDKIYERFDKVQRSFDKLNDVVLEDVVGIRMIRVFNLQDKRTENFKRKGQELKENNMAVVKYQALMQPIQRIIPALTFIIAIAYGSYMIFHKEITIGQLVSFTYYLNMLIWPMYALGQFINLKQLANASMDRIQEVLDYPEDIVDNKGAKDLVNEPAIYFDNFTFQYPMSDEPNLKEIYLDIPVGKSIGVLGRTGSGKTTLLKQFFQLYPANFSRIKVNGESLDHFTRKSMRNFYSYAPQTPMIFSKSIRDNIKFSKPDASDEEVIEVIKMADFLKDLNDFPDGLDTMAGERGISLSGGQKQRISLARALLKDSNLLIIDDGMSAVDGNTEKNIMNNLKKYRNNKSLIIAAHRVSQVKDLDEIIVLDHGEIIERGNHQELMNLKKWYYHQYKRQMMKGGNDG